MKILITSIGKRVQLIKHLKTRFNVIGVDASMNNAAREFTDKFYLVHSIDEAEYVSDILDICEKEQIDIVLPLYEREFLLLCDNRKLIEDNGITKLLLCDDNIINICNNKFNTYEFFKKYNIATPHCYSEHKKFPVIVKPSEGMRGSNVYIANDRVELAFYENRVTNPIVQHLIEGVEYSIDVLCDMDGEIIYVIPRERTEVRAGEVSKSETITYDNQLGKMLVDSTINVIEKLKLEGAVRGPLTVQCFVTYEDEIIFIEIDSRLGGGVPLSFEAGADYAEVLANMVKGIKSETKIGKYDHVSMLRFDDAVYKR